MTAVETTIASVKGVASTVLITVPLLVSLLTLAAVASQPVVWFAVLAYYIFIVTVGIAAGVFLREYDFDVDWDQMAKSTGVGGARDWQGSSLFSIGTVFVFLVGGYSLFGLVVVAVATVGALYVGVLSAVFIPFGMVLIEERLNRKHDKSLIVGGVRLTRWVYLQVARLSARQRTQVKILGALAQIIVLTVQGSTRQQLNEPIPIRG